jgi:uncharacterized Zn finger protein
MAKKEQAQCPYCNSENIEYGVVKIHDEGFVDYPCHCNSCGKDFIEGYFLTYEGMFDTDGNEIK